MVLLSETLYQRPAPGRNTVIRGQECDVDCSEEMGDTAVTIFCRATFGRNYLLFERFHFKGQLHFVTDGGNAVFYPEV